MPKNFFNAIIDNPLSSVFNLGNYLSKNDIQAVDKIKKEFSVPEIQALWHAMAKITSAQWITMSATNRESIMAFKKWFITQYEIYQPIDKNHLIELGQDREYTREVLIALIRLFSEDNHKIFSNPEFDYALLAKAGPQQNAKNAESILGPYIKQCPHLPIDDIKRLGASNALIAEELLLDIHEHADQFEIAAFFMAEKHPQLKSTLLKDWEASANIFSSLSTEKQRCLKDQISILAPKYAEFCAIDKKINQKIEIIEQIKQVEKRKIEETEEKTEEKVAEMASGQSYEETYGSPFWWTGFSIGMFTPFYLAKTFPVIGIPALTLYSIYRLAKQHNEETGNKACSPTAITIKPQ